MDKPDPRAFTKDRQNKEVISEVSSSPFGFIHRACSPPHRDVTSLASIITGQLAQALARPGLPARDLPSTGRSHLRRLSALGKAQGKALTPAPFRLLTPGA